MTTPIAAAAVSTANDLRPRGITLASAVLLLWFGGMCLYVAFMSGKSPAMTVGTSRDGKAQGPKDASELVTRIAANVQAAQGGTGTGEGS